MTTHLGLQRILLPSAQVSSLTTGSITLPSARGQFTDGVFNAIATVTASSTQSSLTFSSIPQTYTHLQIRGQARSDRGGVSDDLGARYNGDTGNNYYAYHQLFGSNTSAGAGFAGNTSYSTVAAGTGLSSTGTGSSIFSAVIIDIFDYTNTNKYKVAKSQNGVEANATGGGSWLNTTYWMNTNSISSIVLFPTLGTNFLTGSTFSLYGIG